MKPNFSCVATLICFCSIHWGHAATTYQWSGVGEDENWSTPGNWLSNAMPTGSEVLIFDNNEKLAMTNDLAAMQRHRILFNSGATLPRSIFGFDANTFVSDGEDGPLIQNNSVAAHVLNFPMLVGPDGLTFETVSGALNMIAPISGTGTVIKAHGTGDGNANQPQNLVITADNFEFTGKWRVTGGNLSINHDLALGDIPDAPVADAITLDGGSLANMSSASGGGFAVGHDLDLNANRGLFLGALGGNIRIGYGRTVVIHGPITGSGGLSRSDGGTLVLTNANNSYAGITHLRAGTLRTDADGALPPTTNVLFWGGSTWNLNGTHQSVAGVHVGSAPDTNTTLNLGGGSLVVTGTTMPTGSPANTGGNFYSRITGTGRIEFAHATNHLGSWDWQNTANDFTGDIIITNGRLRSALGSNGEGVFGNPVNDLIFNGEIVETLGNQEGRASIQATASGALNLPESRSIILNEGKEGTMYVWSNNTYTINGQVTGGGNLRKEDGGTLLLTNPSNNYGGQTRIAAGTLRLGASGVIPDSSPLQMAGGEFHTGGFHETAASLFGTGGNVTGGASLTVTTSDEAEFSGAISGSTVLRMSGTGTQILSGAGDNSSGWAEVTSGTLILAKASTGSVHAVGASNARGLTISGGTLQLAGTGNDQIYFNTLVEQTGGVFDLNGTHEGFRALIGSGGIVRNSAADTLSTLTLGESSVASDAYHFAGALEDGAGQLSLTKTGASLYVLSGPLGHGGDTLVQEGVLRINGSLSESNVIVESGARLGGTGSVAGAVSVSFPGAIAPGDPFGTLTVGSANLRGSLEIEIDGGSADRLTVLGELSITEADLLISAVNPSQAVYIIASYGSLDGSGFLAVSGVPAGYTLDYNYQNANQIALIGSGVTPPFEVWAAEAGLDAGNNSPEADPDDDGRPNLEEFAFDGDPLSSVSDGKILSAIRSLEGGDALVLTVPVRNGAVFTGNNGLTSGIIDGITYRIEGSAELATWNLAVTEVTGAAAAAIHADLPGLSAGWSYRSFRAAGNPGTTSREFLRAGVE